MRKLMLTSLIAGALMLPAMTLQAQDSYGSTANRDRAAASTDRPTARANANASTNTTASATSPSGSMTPPDCLDDTSGGMKTKNGVTAPVTDCNQPIDHGQAVSQAAHDAKAAGKPVGKTVREVAKSDAGKRHADTSTSTSATASTDYTGMSKSSTTTGKSRQVATTKSKERAKRHNTLNMQSEEQQKDQQKDSDQY